MAAGAVAVRVIVLVIVGDRDRGSRREEVTMHPTMRMAVDAVSVPVLDER